MLSATVEVSDKARIFNHLKQLQLLETYKQSTLKDTQSDEFWGPLFPLLGVTTELKDFMSSSVFLNICRSVMEGTCPDISSDLHSTHDASGDKDEVEIEDDTGRRLLEKFEFGVTSEEKIEEEYDHNFDYLFDSDSDIVKDDYRMTSEKALQLVLEKVAIDAQSLATLIVDTCVPKFQQHCNILIKGDLNIPVYVIDNMMDGVSSSECLEKELRQIEFIMGGHYTPPND